MKLLDPRAVQGRLLPYDRFVLFADLGGRLIDPARRGQLLDAADRVLTQPAPIPPLPASSYRRFMLDGNRAEYEAPFFTRQRNLLALGLGLFCTEPGSDEEAKYMPLLIDLLWARLEETSWVLPAHNNKVKGRPASQLPLDYGAEVRYLDLFAASSAAGIALIDYLLADRLEAELPGVLRGRIRYELERRILTPFRRESMGWMGLNRKKVNNWNPWIISNILLITALVTEDDAVREADMTRCVELLNFFLHGYTEEAGCDEGPSYWNVAGASFYDCLELLYDLSGGALDYFDCDFVRSMGEYIVKMHISGNDYVNYADAPRWLVPNTALIARWGRRSSSDMLVRFAAEIDRLNGYGFAGETRYLVDRTKGGAGASSDSCVYRYLRDKADLPAPLFDEPYTPAPFVLLHDLQIMNARAGDYFLSFKGGTNQESHNHNDVGTFIAYVGGQPLFIDAGVNTYTRQTFGPERYTLWGMRSLYHNTASFGSVKMAAGETGEIEQRAGSAHASLVSFDPAARSMTLELRDAYPAEAAILSYRRTGEVSERGIVIRDSITRSSTAAGSGITFNLLARVKPETAEGQLLFVLTPDSRQIRVTYSPALTVSLEPVDVKGTKIGAEWKTDTLWRICLSTPAHAGEFVLKIEIGSL